MGCASRQPYLYLRGGDDFSVFPTEAKEPSVIDCPGTIDERFTCFALKIHQRSAGLSGVFAIVTADGGIHATSTTEPGQSPPTSSDTLFPLASITKMFVAATVVSLEQEGVLDLRQPIARYITEVAGDSELGHVTLHELMTHTAGILDPPNEPLCVHDEPLTSVIERAHIGAPPGAVYLYSNIGYSLVGLVIERATHKPFEDVVRDRILVPMGMTTATFDQSALSVRGHAESGVAPPNCPAMYPAGGLKMSPRDLTRWAHAMSEPDKHPLGHALVEKLTGSYVSTGTRPGETYGYGVQRTEHDGLVIFNHGGNLKDFSAFVAWSTERRFGAVAAVNSFGGAPMVAVLRGMSTFLDIAQDWMPRMDRASHPLSAYTGLYSDTRGSLGRVRVRLAEGRLAFDYVDRTPALLPPSFRFRFAPGNNRARYMVTAIGVGERIGD